MENAITRVEIADSLVFRGEFAADFCPGVNVLIGGNGTGKTTLMKAMYALLSEGEAISAFFANFTDKETVKFGKAALCRSRYDNNPIKAVYIPPEDMLSHATSFLALVNERKMPFNQIHIDILAKAELGETHTVTPNAANVLDRVKTIIGGEVVYENDTFYVVKEDLGKVSFALEASGFRKFGLLWKLLRNGLLESGSYLFWDEPENSLNPELIPALVDILLELQRGGVQIFVATHSYDVARWFELNKKPENSLRYFSFRKEAGGVAAEVADDYISLDKNPITSAGDKLLKKAVEVSAEKAGVKLG